MKSTGSHASADTASVPGKASSVSPPDRNQCLAGHGAVGAGTSRKRSRPPRQVVTEWWHATLKGDVLTPQRGCLRKVSRGGEESSTREPDRRFMANRGDRLILFGATLDEIQSATVLAIKQEGYREQLVVSLGYGELRSSDLWLIRGGRAA